MASIDRFHRVRLLDEVSHLRKPLLALTWVLRFLRELLFITCF
jgi:hypothetical protein